MAKTATQEPATSSQNEVKKQQKKQAKKEAKLMLKVEAAKKDVQKAQQKVAKAQATLEASRTHLHDLEEKLSQMRSSSDTSQNGRRTAPAYSLTSTPVDRVIVVSPAQEQHDSRGEPANSHTEASLPTPTNQVEAVPPAEGRTDVVEEATTSTGAEAEANAGQSDESSDGSSSK
jgi:hypothetical protein